MEDRDLGRAAFKSILSHYKLCLLRPMNGPPGASGLFLSLEDGSHTYPRKLLKE